MNVDVAYVLSHGFAARMILHSDVVPALHRRGLRVAVIAPASHDDEVARLARARDVAYLETSTLAGRRSSLYGQMRPYLHEDVRANPALWCKHVAAISDERRPLTNRARFHAYFALNRVVRRVRPLASALHAFERANLGDRRVRALLEEMRPSLVVATYPVAQVEATFLLEAQRLGILTAGQLLSWDNITAKGYLSVLPDRFLVWGASMRGELEEFYRVDRSRIDEVGVPHWDAHRAALDDRLREGELRRMGLDPKKPYLFFGMSSPELVPFEIEVVEWLARAVEANEFGEAMQLAIRPHPQNIVGDMADTSWLPRIDALQSARVGVNRPRLRESRLAWNLDPSDLPILVNVVAGCAACVNSGSTISLDAIVHDRPTVLAIFDADRRLPWYRSARRYERYVHLRRFLDLDGVRVTHSFDELRSGIRRAIDEPGGDAEGRARTRSVYVGASHVPSSERVAKAIAAMLGRTSDTPSRGVTSSSSKESAG